MNNLEKIQQTVKDEFYHKQENSDFGNPYLDADGIADWLLSATTKAYQQGVKDALAALPKETGMAFFKEAHSQQISKGFNLCRKKSRLAITALLNKK